jgi:hypothetical protein
VSTSTARSRIACALLAGVLGWVAPAFADSETLKARHAALANQLAKSQFQRPLVLESTQTSGDLKGEIFAVMDHPFPVVEGSLKRMDNWCEVLILHLNVKQCRVNGGLLAVSLGKKHDQPLADAYKVDFSYRVAAHGADYLQVQLSAADGPLGTHDYRIVFEAVPIDAQRSFIRMAYSYGYGFAARLAMQAYLSTMGSGKVGFSVVGRTPDGKPVYIDSVRGVIERNTMRYYLAIDAYLDSLAAPPGERLERRLNGWYAATERYPRQLHEMEKGDYMTMKRQEVKRQRDGA